MNMFRIAAAAVVVGLMSVSQAAALTYSFNVTTDFRDSGLETLDLFNCQSGSEPECTASAANATTITGVLDFNQDKSVNSLTFSIFDPVDNFGYSSGLITSGLNDVEIKNKGPGQTDEFKFKFEGLLPSLTEGAADAIFDKFEIKLKDTGGTVFSNANLPATIDFSLFDDNELKVQWDDANEGKLTLKGSLFTTASNPVPAPAALPMLLLGFAGLALMRHRRRVL